MEVYRVNLSGELISEENLIKGFHINPDQKQTIAFVGAGGKTTSMHQLAEELATLGKTVIITTTTHMFLPKQYGVLNENKEDTLRMLNAHHMAMVGIPCGDKKITGVSDSFYQWMKTAVDFVLVEADGSKRLPIKVPSSTEPVIPKDIDMIIVVAGLSCLNKSIEEVCHRPELAASILNCDLAHKIDSKDVAILLKSGYCNNLEKPYKILLNQTDTLNEKKQAMKIATYLDGYNIVISSFTEDRCNRCNRDD